MLPFLMACQHGPTADVTGLPPEEDPAEVIPGNPFADPTLVPGDTAPDTGETGEGDEVDPVYEAFFDTSVLQEVRITLDAAAMRSLERDPTTYVEGAAEINGTSFPSVGVRLKGSSTLQGFSGKPSLKLKLNEYVPGQKYGGLERVTLNNMTSDSTQSKEVINYQLYERAGMTGPKANYAQVWINDELYGLYTNLESMDDHWIARRYDAADGDFWGTASASADFDRANMKCDWCYWVLKSGEGDTTRLLAVKEAIDDASDDFEASMGAVIDADQYLDYWSWNAVIGNGDGYPWTTNDVLIYADPDDGGRFDFSPWGMDESFNSGTMWSASGTRLGNTCTGSASCADEMDTRVCAHLDTWDTLGAADVADALWTVSDVALEADPKRTWTIAEARAARVELAALIGIWSDTLRASNRCP